MEIKEKLNRNQLNQLKRELTVLGIEYDDLDNKNKNKMQEAFLYCKEQCENLHITISQLVSVDINISDFTKSLNISRGALYKKDSEQNSVYASVISYLNDQSAKFNNDKLNLLKRIINENSEDKKLLEQLMVREIQFIEMKNNLNLALNENKSLRNQIEKMNKQTVKLKLEIDPENQKNMN